MVVTGLRGPLAAPCNIAMQAALFTFMQLCNGQAQQAYHTGLHNAGIYLSLQNAMHCVPCMQVLLRKGLINTQELQRWVENLESWGQKPLGPRLVAKAWADPEFKKRLLAEGVGAAKEVDAHVGLFARPAGGVTGVLQLLDRWQLAALQTLCKAAAS